MGEDKLAADAVHDRLERRAEVELVHDARRLGPKGEARPEIWHDGIAALEDDKVDAGLGEDVCGHEADGAAADDDGLEVGLGHLVKWLVCKRVKWISKLIETEGLD